MQCVVLAAGEGKRMRPLTAQRPKVMLPLANRPMADHLVCAARDAGVREFILVVGYQEQAVRDYFGDGSRFNVSIQYATQRHQRGTADALRAAEDLITGTFLVLNGDMVMQRDDIAAIMGRTPPCMGIFRSDRPWDYGAVTTVGDRVTGLVEKSDRPESTEINAGAYLFAPEIFDLIGEVGASPRGEYELTDALAAYIRAGKLTGYPLASWLDVGYPWDLLDANAALQESVVPVMEGTVEEGVTLKGNVSVGRGSTIRSGTYIVGPCVIGEDCVVGPHAYIRGETDIGDRCHIGHATEIKNSVIMQDTKLPHFNYLGDSIVGSGCNFGAGTKVANLRHDHAMVKIRGRDTRRVKMGAVIGDDVLFGINCSVNVGCVIASRVTVAPHAFVEGWIEAGTTVR
jgi:bifunctional UDP-N-acetylglucosamine pyrophosphorylase/glucosamine-1-phosphate N-acetyltransferase